jgi:cytochrome P450
MTGLVLVFAVAETTAKTLVTMTYHLLTNRDLLDWLRDTLSPIISSGSELLSLNALEAVEYLVSAL